MADVDPSYTAPIDLDYIAARHKKEPSVTAFVVLNQGAISKACQDTPEKFDLDCGSDSCPDRHWHTYERYLGCVLDRGDTEDDARAVWFGKKQSINRHDMSLVPFLKPPVPIARVIECHYDACPHGGIHTLDRLITCITAAGRPVDDAIRCWNYHVSYEHRVPLDAFAFLEDPDAPIPAHEEPAVHIESVAPPETPAVHHCTRSGCHHTPAHVKNSKSYVKPVSRHGKKKNKGSLLPVLYSPPRPMDFKRLARVYSQVSDIDALMRHDGGHAITRQLIRLPLPCLWTVVIMDAFERAGIPSLTC